MREAVKVADEVWIAAALLHRAEPQRQSFTQSEIVDRAYQEKVVPTLRPGVQVHVALHCVANKRPNPGNYRMLVALPDGTRRLYREGDEFHPYREGGKTTPRREDIPPKYHALLDWYEHDYNKKPKKRG